MEAASKGKLFVMALEVYFPYKYHKTAQLTDGSSENGTFGFCFVFNRSQKIKKVYSRNVKDFSKSNGHTGQREALRVWEEMGTDGNTLRPAGPSL